MTQTNLPAGMRSSTDFKLLPLQPVRLSHACSSLKGRRLGTPIARVPLIYWPVIDAEFCSICAGVPCATICPPCSPAPGPISTTQSACRIISSSCSTTITLLPKSRRWCSVAIKRSLSRWCRPIEGSSNTYMTPVNPEPIWLASRMRCASPPEIVSALRSSDK